MAVPRRKTSPSRRGMRRSADALKKPTYAEDKDSGELRGPHHLDLKTGMYKGRQVLKAKKDPGERRPRAWRWPSAGPLDILVGNAVRVAEPGGGGVNSANTSGKTALRANPKRRLSTPR